MAVKPPRNKREEAQRKKAWAEANPDRYVRGRLVACAKLRAKKRDLPFNITPDDIVIPTHCPVLGIPILVSSTRTCCANSPSIDRIIPSRGYVKGNVIVISMRANSIKSNAKPDEILKVAYFYDKLINKSD
jgi:hypothetical protein